MKNVLSIRLCASIAGFALTNAACEPPSGMHHKVVDTAQSGSATPGDGMGVLALVPVRNFSPNKLLGDSSDKGVQQAAAMVKTRLLALIECNTVISPQGIKLTGGALMGLLQSRATLDDLYVDASRHLTISADESAMLDFEKGAGSSLTVPCHLVGQRMLSFAVLNDMQVRVAGMPKTLPADLGRQAVIQRTFALAQAVHLAVRSKHASQSATATTPTAQAIVDMAASQGTKTISLSQFMARVQAADSIYNPCVNQVPNGSKSVPFPYTAAWKRSNFSCETYDGSSDLITYQAGGEIGANYEAVRNMLAREIQRTHEHVVYPHRNSNDPDLQNLWDLLTSTAPWTSAPSTNLAGTNGAALATYLAGGLGVDFATTFKSKVAATTPNLNLTAATDLLRTASLSGAAAPSHAATLQKRGRIAVVRQNPRINWSAGNASSRPASMAKRMDFAHVTAVSPTEAFLLDALKSQSGK